MRSDQEVARGAPGNGGAPQLARASGARVVRLADMRDAHGRLLFARGAIPRRRLMGGARPSESAPPGVIGSDHPHEPLSTHELYGGWWRWRREGVNWEHPEDLRDGARPDVKRVAEHGVGGSRTAFVRSVTFGWQIPPVLNVDRTVCQTETEALMVTIIDGYVNCPRTDGMTDALRALIVGS